VHLGRDLLTVDVVKERSIEEEGVTQGGDGGLLMVLLLFFMTKVSVVTVEKIV
jgi:hypothetical protein